MIGVYAGRVHFFEKIQGLKGVVRAGKLSDKRGPGDNILELIMGCGEEEQAPVNMATFGVHIEEIVEEKRETSEAVVDELGVYLSCMVKVFGIDGGIKKMIEVGRSMEC